MIRLTFGSYSQALKNFSWNTGVLTIYYGKPGNFSWRNKWIALFRFRKFRKYGLRFRAMQFYHAFYSVRLIWIYSVSVAGSSPTTSNFKGLCWCTRFPPRWIVLIVSVPRSLFEFSKIYLRLFYWCVMSIHHRTYFHAVDVSLPVALM